MKGQRLQNKVEGGSISISYSVSMQLFPLNPKEKDGMRVANLSQASTKLVVPLHLESMFNPKLSERDPELSTRAKLVSAYCDWA